MLFGVFKLIMLSITDLLLSKMNQLDMAIIIIISTIRMGAVEGAKLPPRVQHDKPTTHASSDFRESNTFRATSILACHDTNI